MQGRTAKIFVSVLYILSAIAPAVAMPDQELDKLETIIVDATTTNKPHAVVACFEPNLAAGYARASNKPNASTADFGWMTNSDEPDMQAIQLTIESKIDKVSEKEATIKITFLQDGEPFRIDYLLRKAKTTWLIFDVTYPDEAFSLRDFVIPR